MIAPTKSAPRNRLLGSRDLPAAGAPSSKKGKKADTATVTTVDRLVIPRVEFEWASIELIGVSPLIANRFRDSAIRQMEDAQQGGAKTKKEPRKPEVEFFESNHICEVKGKPDHKQMEKCLFGFPAIGLKKAIANAAYRFGGAKNIVSIASVLFVHGPYGGLMPLYDADSKKKLVAAMPTMRRDPVVLANGSASIAYRPEYTNWKLVVDIRFWPAVISLESLVNGLSLAGQLVGIGAWRIENKGDKGAFSVGTVKSLPADYVPHSFASL